MKIYVCQTNEDQDFAPEAVFRSEDNAREWMRNKFVELRDRKRLENEDFSWDEYTMCLTGNCTHLWECYANDMDHGWKVWEIEAPLDPSSETAYVPQEETPEGFFIERIFQDLESARGWQRNGFLEHRKLPDAGGADDYAWSSDEENGFWTCTYMPDRVSWCVFRLPIRD